MGAGVVTVYDCCAGSAVHSVGGLGHVTSLDLYWTNTCLTVAIATNQQIPGDMTLPPVSSDITVLTCLEGTEWQTRVLRPHPDHTSSTVSPALTQRRCDMVT